MANIQPASISKSIQGTEINVALSIQEGASLSFTAGNSQGAGTIAAPAALLGVALPGFIPVRLSATSQIVSPTTFNLIGGAPSADVYIGLLGHSSFNVATNMPNDLIYPFTDHMVVEINLGGTGATATIAQADLFTYVSIAFTGSVQFGASFGANNVMLVADKTFQTAFGTAPGANVRFLITHLLDNVGEVNGRVGGIFLTRNRVIGNPGSFGAATVPTVGSGS